MAINLMAELLKKGIRQSTATATDLVDVSCNAADGSRQLFLLGVIDLDDVPVDEHFPGICAEVVRSQLAHLMLDEI